MKSFPASRPARASRGSAAGLSVAAVAALLAGATVFGVARPATAKPRAVAQAPTPRPGDWVTPDPDDLLVIDTNKGRIIVEMVPEAAPLSVARIQTLARQHFYDGLSFFRVVDDFMAQTGDPKNTGEGGSTLPSLKGEFTFRRTAETPFVQVSAPDGEEQGLIGPLAVISQPSALMGLTVDGSVEAWGAFCAGSVGMARTDAPDSANSQFFLMRQATPSLEKKYAAIGRVIVGLDVVRELKVGEPVAAPQDKMLKVRLASDMPASGRPKVQVLNPASPAFQAELAADRAIEGPDIPICDVDVQVQSR